MLPPSGVAVLTVEVQIGVRERKVLVWTPTNERLLEEGTPPRLINPNYTLASSVGLFIRQPHPI